MIMRMTKRMKTLKMAKPIAVLISKQSRTLKGRRKRKRRRTRRENSKERLKNQFPSLSLNYFKTQQRLLRGRR